eukprot:jgi/Mesvir1/8605/Mv05623-RA.1
MWGVVPSRSFICLKDIAVMVDRRGEAYVTQAWNDAFDLELTYFNTDPILAMSRWTPANRCLFCNRWLNRPFDWFRRSGSGCRSSETAKGTVDALICNLLSVACERAGQFVLHNAEQVRDKHVVGILHAALLAETITYMERPSLEDEIEQLRSSGLTTIFCPSTKSMASAESAPQDEMYLIPYWGGVINAYGSFLDHPELGAELFARDVSLATSSPTSTLLMYSQHSCALSSPPSPSK